MTKQGLYKILKLAKDMFNNFHIVKLLILLIAFLFSGCSMKDTSIKPFTVESLKKTYTQIDRIEKVAYPILVSNKQICSKQYNNYGLTAATLNANATVKSQKIWKEVFNIKNRPTVIRITPNSVAYTTGLKIGDEFISVNKVAIPSEISQHYKVYDSLKAPSINITVLRNTKQLSFYMIAEKTCDVKILLSQHEGTNAFAKENKIVIEAELEKLLENDDELALVIAHELAHIILGHTSEERQNELDIKQMRAMMEKDADALGMHLFLNAGYNPEVALKALEKMDYNKRGPISRFLGLYGPYMPTEKRIQ